MPMCTSASSVVFLLLSSCNFALSKMDACPVLTPVASLVRANMAFLLLLAVFYVCKHHPTVRRLGHCWSRFLKRSC